MPETFDIVRYMRELCGNWRAFTAAAIAAALLAGGMTALLPTRYTATARLIIEPPAGSDARTPQVITPQYLESLRTYESLATSDSLFYKALERFGLRKESPSRPAEAWKKDVLKVALVRNTKVLEIAVTLRDAKTAHQMAQFLAGETIRASRDLSRTADDELVQQAGAALRSAAETAEQTEKAWRNVASSQLLTPLESELELLYIRQRRIERMLLEAEVRASGASAAARPPNSRLQLLRAEQEQVKKAIQRTAALHAQREEIRRPAEEERKAALARVDDAQKRLSEARAMVGYRGNRLHMIDPGVVPERPSSPNFVLNIFGAVIFALAATAIYLSLRFVAAAGQRDE